MMPFQLTLQFSGLCLFVQEQKREDPGLFVLMPKCMMPGMEHYPAAFYDGQYAGGAGPVYQKLNGTVVNLRGLVKNTKGAQLPVALANASQYVQRAVDSKWTRGPIDPKGSTIARIELDLGLELVTDPQSTAVMEIDYGGAEHFQPMSGVGSIAVQVADPNVKGIEIGGTTLTPVDDEIQVVFGNLPMAEYSPTHHPAASYPGEKSPHFEAFYSLLVGQPTGPVPMYPIKPVPPQIREKYGIKGMPMGTDPVECLMGGGCPEEDPDCLHP